MSLPNPTLHSPLLVTLATGRQAYLTGKGMRSEEKGGRLVHERVYRGVRVAGRIEEEWTGTELDERDRAALEGTKPRPRQLTHEDHAAAELAYREREIWQVAETLTRALGLFDTAVAL